MAVTSYSYLDEHRNGIIRLLSDDVWTTTVYTISASFEAVITRFDLYPVLTSGAGVLSADGKSLTITIPMPPKYLKLTVGSFSKNFSFLEGGIDGAQALVYAPSFKITTMLGSGGSTIAEGFILFNHEPEMEFDESAIRGTLAVGEECRGYLLGKRFNRVTTAVGNAAYGFGGFIFPRCTWLKPPTEPEVLDLYVKAGEGLFKAQVFHDGVNFTGPTHPRFDVQPDHIFRVNRFSNHFFL